MKKILLFFVVIFATCFSFLSPVHATGGSTSCHYSEGTDLSSFLDECQPSTVVGGDNMKLEDGLRTKVLTWISNAAVILGVLAVGALVYAGMLMQFSMGEDEKNNKAKKIITRTLIGVLVLISAGAIIYMIINVMFGLGDN